MSYIRFFILYFSIGSIIGCVDINFPTGGNPPRKVDFGEPWEICVKVIDTLSGEPLDLISGTWRGDRVPGSPGWGPSTFYWHTENPNPGGGILCFKGGSSYSITQFEFRALGYMPKCINYIPNDNSNIVMKKCCYIHIDARNIEPINETDTFKLIVPNPRICSYPSDMTVLLIGNQYKDWTYDAKEKFILYYKYPNKDMVDTLINIPYGETLSLKFRY